MRSAPKALAYPACLCDPNQDVVGMPADSAACADEVAALGAGHCQ